MQRLIYNRRLLDLTCVAVAIGLLALWRIGNVAMDPDAAAANWKPELLQILPGLATEVLGALLTIRVIDALLKRRELYDRARTRIVDNVRYFFGNAKKIWPHYERFRIVELEDELTTLKENLGRWTKLLDESERMAASKCVALEEKILRTTNLMVWLLNELEGYSAAVEEADRNAAKGDTIKLRLREARSLSYFVGRHRTSIQEMFEEPGSLFSCLADARGEFTALAPECAHAAEKYLNSIERAFHMRETLGGEVTELQEAFAALRRDVEEETPARIEAQ